MSNRKITTKVVRKPAPAIQKQLRTSDVMSLLKEHIADAAYDFDRMADVSLMLFAHVDQIWRVLQAQGFKRPPMPAPDTIRPANLPYRSPDSYAHAARNQSQPKETSHV